MTLPVERVITERGGLDADAVQRSLDLFARAFPVGAGNLASNVPATPSGSGPYTMNFGTGQVTFTASQTSANTLVNHGLGVVPALLLVCATGSVDVMYSTSSATSPTALQFGVQGFRVSGPFTASPFFYWLAIG